MSGYPEIEQSGYSNDKDELDVELFLVSQNNWNHLGLASRSQASHLSVAYHWALKTKQKNSYGICLMNFITG